MPKDYSVRTRTYLIIIYRNLIFIRYFDYFFPGNRKVHPICLRYLFEIAVDQSWWRGVHGQFANYLKQIY